MVASPLSHQGPDDHPSCSRKPRDHNGQREEYPGQGEGLPRAQGSSCGIHEATLEQRTQPSKHSGNRRFLQGGLIDRGIDTYGVRPPRQTVTCSPSQGTKAPVRAFSAHGVGPLCGLEAP